ncbi:hypothetical protein GIB67_029321 [Kingdonia uniflora]|uniref:Uncharacterized protein n=1 Tax=Kingdonia uniflora TaxID=39325 RepID=A0A7J7N8X6_9MAGN|nr:hypothetical protein GIB67_029321 [Kingdonia uniflora]
MSFKLFTDASWSETIHKGGMGFLLVNETNKPILAGHTPLTADDAKQVEGKCIPWAIKLSAQEIQGQKILLLRDCSNVSSYLRDPLSGAQWSTASQLQPCLTLFFAQSSNNQFGSQSVFRPTCDANTNLLLLNFVFGGSLTGSFGANQSTSSSTRSYETSSAPTFGRLAPAFGASPTPAFGSGSSSSYRSQSTAPSYFITDSGQSTFERRSHEDPFSSTDISWNPFIHRTSAFSPCQLLLLPRRLLVHRQQQNLPKVK